MGKTRKRGAGSEDPQQEYQDKLNRKGKQQKLRPGIEKDLSKLQGKLKNQEDISDARIGKFARALASTDWHTRERALSMFETFLRSSENVPSDGLRKMWKGLYYSFWHSDKVPVQQELAKRLSSLVSSLEVSPLVALAYWRAFLDTMVREWSFVDRHRLDKFMSLVRMFVHACLSRMSTHEWHPDVVVPMWDGMRETLLLANDVGKGTAITGLALHITSVFVDELEQVCSSGQGQDELPDVVPSDVLSFLVEPFMVVMCTSNSMALVKRVIEAVYAKLAKKCMACMRQIEQGEDAKVEDVSKGYPFVQIDALLMAKELFDVAADPGTNQHNREKIYDVIALVEQLAEYQRGWGLAEGSSAPSTPSADGSKPRKKKKGVVFKLQNNEVFRFHKRDAVTVQKSPSAHKPMKSCARWA